MLFEKFVRLDRNGEFHLMVTDSTLRTDLSIKKIAEVTKYFGSFKIE